MTKCSDKYGRYHRLDGPAIPAINAWYWHGIRMNPKYIKIIEKLTPNDLHLIEEADLSLHFTYYNMGVRI